MGWLVLECIISCLITISLMKISIKFGWSKALWSALEKKIKIKNPLTFYIISFVIFMIIVQSFCHFIGMNSRSVSYRSIRSIVYALGFAFLPTLAEISQ